MQIVIPFSFFAEVFVYKRESFKLVAGWFSNYGPPLQLAENISDYVFFISGNLEYYF